MNTSIIRNAIANREVIEFIYRGYPRVAEPHAYGIKDGKRQIVIFQVGGLSSAGTIQDWRRIGLDEITGLKATGVKFEGPRADRPAEYDSWDTIISIVK